MISSNENSAPLSAIAWLRWRLFLNALRTTQGKLELLSRILVSIAFSILGLGGAFGMVFLGFFSLSQGKLQLLALFLWIIFFFWQIFPVMASAFTSNSDSSDLLRFPLSYRSYFLVRLAYGAFDPASAIGILWTFGILVGVSFAKPALLPWAMLVLLAFATFNLLFMQMIFAWVERWLAQRRTREIMGILFILLMLSFQLIGPLAGHFGKRERPELQRVVEWVGLVQGILPPGLAADAIVQGIYPQWGTALSSLALLSAFVLVIAYGLHIRLWAQYRGENLNEVPAASTLRRDRQLRIGWKLPGLSTPVAAVFEKEIRYLLRSGPMMLTFIMPIFMLLVFRFGAMNSLRHSRGFFARTPDMAFLRLSGKVPRHSVSQKSRSCRHSGGRNSARVDRSLLPIRPACARHHHRHTRRPTVRCASKFCRRQCAFDVFAEKTGLLQIRRPTRLPDDGAGRPRPANCCGRHWCQRVLDGALLREFLDRNTAPSFVGRSIDRSVQNDS
jgi:hypothetical protein